MASIYLIFICLFVGYALKRFHLVESNRFKVLNTLVIYVGLPALTLHFIPKVELNPELIYPIMMPWLNILFSWLLFAFIGYKLKWSKALTGAIIIMAGFGNTSFVGIPVIQALYGAEGIKTVLMVDQPGSFVALTTLGIFLANVYANRHKITAQGILKNIAKFPPFIAFVVSFVLNIMHVSIPVDIDTMLSILGGLVVPLALISVGMQIKLDFRSVHWKYVWLTLGFKLLLFPAVIFTLYFFVFQQRGQVIDITVIESAMAPMITAGIIAINYGLKPRFCSLILSVGLLVSFVTIPIWYWLIETLIH